MFEDSELELTIRADVGRLSGPLTSADVAGLTSLTAGAVVSLKGVECLTELTLLDIGSLPPGRVSDLGPLATLAKLERIDLSRNPIASLAPLL